MNSDGTDTPISSRPVRVRVAPSPTGDPHVGTAYQALFNYAFAKSRGGVFVVRIEDTDQERSSPQAETAILDALIWLGLTWDEGPRVGGPHAPYRQSERLELYRHHADRLLAEGHAYRDFSTKEELAERRRRQQETGIFEPHERSYRDLSVDDSDRRAAVEPFTLRLKVPLDGDCVMHDLLRGEIRREWKLVDDQILLKSDGFPTYHLANVVDDHEMAISHVIRGEEWINSVPKHLHLYQCFGWQPPVFCHLPLLRNNDATKSKLSKRKNPTSIDYYRATGYLPQALSNYLGLMCSSRADGDEKFPLSELVASFRPEDVSLGGPVFDIDKLRWLNARYLREDYDPESLWRAIRDWGFGPKRIAGIVSLAQPRLETLADWGSLTAHFFTAEVDSAADLLTLKGSTPGELAGVLQLAVWRLERLPGLTAAAAEAELRHLGDRLGIKLRDLTRPFYVAISGKPASTPLFQTLEILGPDLVRSRLRRAIEVLGGLSGKRIKELEKQLAELDS